MKTVILYNNIDLFAKEELENIVRILKATVLSGLSYQATINSLLRFNYDCIWYIGHTRDKEILIGDKWVSLSSLTPILSNVTLLVLNGCSSFLTLSTLQDLDPELSFIASISDVQSNDAYLFGSVFATNLVKFNYDYVKAYNEIGLIDEQYILITGDKTLSSGIDELTKAIYDLKNELNLTNYRLQQVEEIVKYLPKNNLKDTYIYINIVLSVVVSLLGAYALWSLLQ